MRKTLFQKFIKLIFPLCIFIGISNDAYSKPLPKHMRFGFSAEVWVPWLDFVAEKFNEKYEADAKMSQGIPADFYLYYGYNAGNNFAIDGVLLVPIPKTLKIGSSESMLEMNVWNAEFCIVPRLIIQWFYFKMGIGIQYTISAKAKHNDEMKADPELGSEESDLKARNVIDTIAPSVPFGFGMETPFGLSIGVKTAIISTVYYFIKAVSGDEDEDPTTKRFYSGYNNFTRNNIISLEFGLDIPKLVNKLS